MALLERPEDQKLITSTLLLSVLAGAVVFAIMMMVAASRLGGQVTMATTSRLALGPVGLAEIHKTAVSGGGYQGSVQLLPGMLAYTALVLVLGAALAYYRIHRTHGSTS